MPALNSYALRRIALLLLTLAAAWTALPAEPQTLSRSPLTNRPSPIDLNTPRQFPPISSRQQWQERAGEIRQQILVTCGLWPLPDKTPLQAHIFGKIERDGYSVEKVYFQAFPGFYLAGNLYRPLGRGNGPFPAILNPHGHWKEGRLADTKEGSIPARCISLARQGMIAFSYDMVGFNDTHFADTPANRPFYEVHRQFGTNRTDQLWSISLLGLQTWNGIRALDFLESLPDADPKRLACTGESGGGTQTYLLGAVDERLAAQAPVVMVSHIMQGGCSCENAPGLRVEYSNMEIAAAAAPRPQLLVAATGDWTRDTLTVEGPAIAHIYQLLAAPEKFHYVRFDFGHNYNQTSREAVYQWFGQWLLHNPESDSPKEAPYQKEPDADLRVFPNGQLPADAMTQAQFIDSLKKLHQAQWQALLPRTQAGLEKFKYVMLPAWRHTLQVDWPLHRPQVQSEPLKTSGPFFAATMNITRQGEETPPLATYWAPPGILANPAPKLVVLCTAPSRPSPRAALQCPSLPAGGAGSSRSAGARIFLSAATPERLRALSLLQGRSSFRVAADRNVRAPLRLWLCHAGASEESRPERGLQVTPSSTRAAPGNGRTPPSGLTLKLLQHGMAVLVIDRFTASDTPDQFANFYTTYNRTQLQQRVRDLVTVCASVGSVDPRRQLHFRVILCGCGRAGPAALLAAPAADAVIADCDGLDAPDDQALLSPDLFCPGLRNLGTFTGAALLTAPHPLLLHNTGKGFPSDALRAAYKAAAATKHLQFEPTRSSDDALVNWVARL